MEFADKNQQIIYCIELKKKKLSIGYNRNKKHVLTWLPNQDVMVRLWIHISWSENIMETNRKVITAVNYYRKNILKKYFQIWKMYSDHKLYLIGKSKQILSNSYLDSKVHNY